MYYLPCVTNHRSYNLIPHHKCNQMLPIIHFKSNIQNQPHIHCHIRHTLSKSISNSTHTLSSYSFCVKIHNKTKTKKERKKEKIKIKMASTQCFLHHQYALTTPSRSLSQRQIVSNKPNHIVCKAQKQDDDDVAAVSFVSRRLALSVILGAAAVGSKVSPADAAYGEAANVFGKAKTNTDFLPYNGDGFKLLVPAKWNPSKEREFPGQVLRYEDNFDATSNVSVIVQTTDKKSITDYGSPEEFLSKVDYLLGKQAFFGQTDSEGGFDTNAVAVANVLESSTPVIGGKQYFNISVLTRTADGDEGGKHQLITATVNDGKLYICKAQAGDKRWFKGARKFVEDTASSFSVA